MPSSAATEALPNPSAPKTQLKGAIAPPTPPATPSEKALLPEQRHAQQLRAAQFDQIFDPSHQLNELESDELRLFLQRCNANDACKLWLAVVPGEAPAPAEELLSQLHRSTQPALLLELRMGSRLQLDLAQRGKLFTEEELHQLNVQLQERLTGHHYPLSSLRSGLQLLHPILAQLPERSEAERAEGTLHLPLVQLQLQTKKDKQEEQLLQEALEKKQQHELLLFLREYALPLCLVFLSLLSCCSLYLVGRHLRRWRVTLLPTGKEERLSSPYGASVSPPVDYAKRNSQSLLG